MAAAIGIKIANGEFYSIIKESSSIKRRLILTTVHDNQRSVQIDLYKSETKTMADALYIGSLVIENIKPRSKGDPSIEMVIESSGNGTVTATATDMDSSGRQLEVLNVSLKTLDEDQVDIPDYELEAERNPSGLYGKVEHTNDEKSGNLLHLVIVLSLILLAIGFCVWYFFFKDVMPIKKTFTGNVAEQQIPNENMFRPLGTGVSGTTQRTTIRTRPVAPVYSFSVPVTIPREGFAYRIRWGDTLWDIADVFYHNPWSYPRIASFNNIRNPDLIIPGTVIRIPPAN